MVRSVGRERDGSKTGNEQNERARILKLVALGQNEGKSSVRLWTTLLPPRHRATPSMEIWDPSKDTRCKLFLYLNTYLCAVSATAWVEFARVDSFVLLINNCSCFYNNFTFFVLLYGKYIYFPVTERNEFEFEEKYKEMIGDYCAMKVIFRFEISNL